MKRRHQHNPNPPPSASEPGNGIVLDYAVGVRRTPDGWEAVLLENASGVVLGRTEPVRDMSQAIGYAHSALENKHTVINGRRKDSWAEVQERRRQKRIGRLAEQARIDAELAAKRAEQ